MWKRGAAEVDVNREVPARAPPPVLLDDGGRGEPLRDGCERGRTGLGRTRQD